MLAVFTVNTHLDVVDANDNFTSLREAVALANAQVGEDTIEFDAALAGKTISLAHGQLHVTESIVIMGVGSEQLTIDAHHESRIFNFTETAVNASVSGLTLYRGWTGGQNNDPASGDTTYSGGAVRFASIGNLTLSDVVVSNSNVYGPHTRGGGVFVKGSLTMLSSAVINCSTNSYNGDGGGIWVGLTATVDDSIIRGNTGGGGNSDGGGISAGGIVMITNCIIADNSSVDDGGGVWSYSDVTVIGSIVSGNSTTLPMTQGGGIASGTMVTVISSTIFGNSAYDLGGGGIWARHDVIVRHSTISGNSTGIGELSEGGGIWTDRDLVIEFSTITGNSAGGNGGGIRGGRRTTSISHSIVAGNTSLQGTHDILRMSPFGFSVDYSLIGDNTGTVLAESQSANANGSLIGSSTGGGAINPKLGPLADNGGSVLTHALLPSSPAIDAGNPALASPPSVDSRGTGFDRIRDGNGDLNARVDMGAFEVQTPFVPSADFNGDGFVDGNDFLVWQRGFGITSIALPIDGDANGDLVVNGDDLVIWRSEFGNAPEEMAVGFEIELDAAQPQAAPLYSSVSELLFDGEDLAAWSEEFDIALEEMAVGFGIELNVADPQAAPLFFPVTPESLFDHGDEEDAAKERVLAGPIVDGPAPTLNWSPRVKSELANTTDLAGSTDDDSEAEAEEIKRVSDGLISS